MMWLDILALIIVIGFALAGASSGGTRQLLRLGAAIAAVLVAPWLAPYLAGPLAATFPELPLVVITGLSVILCSVMIYLILALIARLITDVIIKSSTILTVADQALGFGLGLVTATILLLIIGHVLLAIQPSLTQFDLVESRYLSLVQSVPIRDLLQLARAEAHVM